jgi:hypothetical protein
MELSTGLAQPLAKVKNAPVAANLSVGAADFPVEAQQMSNWCWAASASALTNFYNNAAGPSTQPQIVAQVLEMDVCASGLPTDDCNKMADFSVVLTDIHHLQAPMVDDILEQQKLIDQLTNNNPVGCQMNIPGIGGHIVLVVAATTDGQGTLFVTVADPADGTLPVMTYAQLSTDFRGHGGQWVRSYLTD